MNFVVTLAIISCCSRTKRIAHFFVDRKFPDKSQGEDIKGKVSELLVNDIQMICGDEIMRDGKRLYSYGIDDGSVLDFIKLNRSPYPVEDAVPQVAPPQAEEAVEEDVGEDIGDAELEQLLYGVDEPDQRDWDESHKFRRESLDNGTEIIAQGVWMSRD